jgi:AcrR family transcriptional regulator
VSARTVGEAGTAARILDVAERLVQTRGFNGFSYADVAGELGVTKASLHYRFPGKAERGEALIISTLEGAMLMARPYGDPQRFRAAALRLLASLDGEQGGS